MLYQDAPDFQKYVDADAQKMAEVVKRIGKLEQTQRQRNDVRMACLRALIDCTAPT